MFILSQIEAALLCYMEVPINSKIRLTKSTSCWSIQPPNTTSTNAMTISFGTKVIVCSLMEVAACIIEINRPTNMLTSKIGAATLKPVKTASLNISVN